MDALDRQRMKQSPALRAQAYHGSLPTFTLRCSAALRPTPELYSRTPLSGERGDAAREAELLPCLTVTIVHGPGHPYVKHTTKIFSLRLMDFQAQAYPDARRKTRGACQLHRGGQSQSPVRPLCNRKRFS